MSEPFEKQNSKSAPSLSVADPLAAAAPVAASTVSISLKPPLTSDIPFLRPRLRNVPVRYTSFPVNIDWDNIKALLEIFPQPRPLKDFGTRLIPKCLLMDSPTPRDKLIVVNWWRNLSGKQQNQEFNALREIYRAPLRDNSPWQGMPKQKGVKYPKQPDPEPRSTTHQKNTEQSPEAAVAVAARKPAFAPPPRPPTPPPPELLVNPWYLPRHKKTGAIAKRLLPIGYENRKRPDAVAVLRIFKPAVEASATTTTVDCTTDDSPVAPDPSTSDIPFPVADSDLLFGFSPPPPPPKKIKTEQKPSADRKCRPRVQMTTAGDTALLKQIFQSKSEWSKKSIQRQLDLTCALNYNTRIPQMPCDILTNVHQAMELAPPDTIIQQDASLRFDEFLS